MIEVALPALHADHALPPEGSLVIIFCIFYQFIESFRPHQALRFTHPLREMSMEGRVNVSGRKAAVGA
jgi:hypothetical protein